MTAVACKTAIPCDLVLSLCYLQFMTHLYSLATTTSIMGHYYWNHLFFLPFLTASYSYPLIHRNWIVGGPPH